MTGKRVIRRRLRTNGLDALMCQDCRAVTSLPYGQTVVLTQVHTCQPLTWTIPDYTPPTPNRYRRKTVTA
jgi:hypothetical protein